MQKELFDADEFDEYVNEDCPAGCSEDHGEPTPNHLGQWRCPSSDELFTIDGGSWEPQNSRYPDCSNYVGAVGEWYIYPYDHGWNFCEYCDEWRDADGMQYNRWGESRGCEYCYSENDDEYGSEPETVAVRCEHCNDRNVVITHWDPMTEAVSCGTCAKGEPVPTLVAA